MASPEIAHHEAEIRREEAAAILARRQWRQMSPDDLEGSWARIVQRLTLIVGSAQLGAARAGAAYVPQVVDVDPEGEVNPSRWVGTASDGRALDSLLFSAVVRVRSGLGSGLVLPDAMSAGAKWLDTIVRTQVADADRGAAGVAIAARPHVGYVRVVSPPCCQRCAVLAGKWFKWNTGFQRHPKCDCRHSPQSEDAPRGYTADIKPNQVKDLTEAQRKAIADGADMNQVINAHRKGARSSDGMTTSEGTTRRGLAGQRRTGQRLTPEAIYRVSSTREEALGLLRKHGYLL